MSRRHKCRVVTAYQSAYPDPFIIHAGEELTVEEKESPWSGWLWCTNRNGESRWVPETYVARRGKTGLALYDYDATELSVNVGEELTIIKQESGWIWCTNREGEHGWVPAENIQKY